jgi:hypothetical protein
MCVCVMALRYIHDPQVHSTLPPPKTLNPKTSRRMFQIAI